jgi:hypothetical protein
MVARHFCHHTGGNKHQQVIRNKKLMKSIVSLTAIAALAALALVGCNQNSPGNSTETPSPNSSMNHANGMMDGPTHMPATNNMPNMDTNMPAKPKSTGAANDATR